ncbi:hypothetical protein [Pedobacter sp.]|jgi:hypothetical protein|uniref:hypothetical protein n=1 Tax=Pedobacter sp. TaxID=1411316 RepID=UPI002BE2F23A|nr:hypothetical protein [Pedobacter sp.]HWW41414.1 hypothetical protein [Pedobacter sp.]
MVKSQFKSFGFWFMIAVVLFGAILFFSAFLNTRTEQQKQVCLISGPIFSILFGWQLWRDASVILIDKLNKTISFTNLFTRRQSIISFDDLDGFIDVYQAVQAGRIRVIYLVRDKKFVKKLSSYYYSNLDELQEALTPIKYLGLQNFNIIKSVKILFNLRVLK